MKRSKTCLSAQRIIAIDTRLEQIEAEKKSTKNEELLIILGRERLALTNERVALTIPAPAPAQGNVYLSCEFN